MMPKLRAVIKENCSGFAWDIVGLGYELGVVVGMRHKGKAEDPQPIGMRLLNILYPCT